VNNSLSRVIIDKIIKRFVFIFIFEANRMTCGTRMDVSIFQKVSYDKGKNRRATIKLAPKKL